MNYLMNDNPTTTCQIGQFRERLQGRLANARRTAALHSDWQERERASDRAKVYQTVLTDLDELSPEEHLRVSAPDWQQLIRSLGCV
jgi:hypothetical protein